MNSFLAPQKAKDYEISQHQIYTVLEKVLAKKDPTPRLSQTKNIAKLILGRVDRLEKLQE